MKKLLFPMLSAALLASPAVMADEDVATADDVFSSPTADQNEESTETSVAKQKPKKSKSRQSAPSAKSVPTIPTLKDVESRWHDPAFDQFVSIPLLGQAIDANDVEGLTNSALQFVHAERVLFRSHKAITAEDVFSKALKAAHQANEETCIDRLSKAAKASGNSKLTGIVDSVGKLMAGSRSTGGQLTVNIDDIDADQYRELCALRDSACRAQLIGHPTEYESVRCQIEESECPQQCREQLLQTLGHPPEGADETCQALQMLADYTRSCNGGGGFGGMSHGGGMQFGGMVQGGMTHGGGFGHNGGFRSTPQMQPIQQRPPQMRATPGLTQPASRPLPQRQAYSQPVRTAAPGRVPATGTARPQQPTLAQQVAKLSPQQKAALIQQLGGGTQPRPATPPATGVRPAAATRPTMPRPTTQSSRPTLPARSPANAAASLLGAGSRSLNDDGGESQWAPWFEVNADGTETQGWTEHKPDGSWVKYDSEGNSLEAGYDANTYTGNPGAGDDEGDGDEPVGVTVDYTQNADGSTSWTQYDANGNVVDRGIEINAAALNAVQKAPHQQQPPQRQPQPQQQGRRPQTNAQSAASPTGTAPAAGNLGSRITIADAEQALRIHNQARAEVGVAPLKWSAKLAATAQQFADELAQSGQFQHSARGRFGPVGENLAMGTRYTAANGVQRWYDEKQNWLRGSGVAGHYTQMVWQGTTEVGIGIAYRNSAYGKEAYIVAHYNPAGNYTGQSVYPNSQPYDNR